MCRVKEWEEGEIGAIGKRPGEDLTMMLSLLRISLTHPLKV